jgi:hypothetical protein
MQQNYLELWESINQSSLELLKKISESNQAAFNSLLKGQWDMATFGKLGQTTLDTTKTIADTQTSAVNSLLHNTTHPEELEAMAYSIEELGKMVSTMATTLTELQVNAFSSFVSDYTNSLRSMKAVGSTEDLIAIQTHYYQQLQERLKSSATDTLERLNALNGGLKAWMESSVDKMAES